MAAGPGAAGAGAGVAAGAPAAVPPGAAVCVDFEHALADSTSAVAAERMTGTRDEAMPSILA
jgi:hypothetical protein